MGEVFDDLSAQAAKNHCLIMWEHGASIDGILSYLKSSGFSQGISVFILQRAVNIAHFNAKQAVIKSEVWADSREANTKLHNAINDISDEENK